MGKTSIEWTDCSWNPVVGCTEVSPGCANCYAARLAATRLKNLLDYQGLITSPAALHSELDKTESVKPRWNGMVRLLEDRLQEPLHWKKPRKIFVCDMADLFHESVPEEYIDRVWAVMAMKRRHTFQVLTKRPKRMQEYLNFHSRDVRVSLAPFRIPGITTAEAEHWVPILEDYMRRPLPNVWLGVSVENQHFADERIPLLSDTPAAVRFLSCEPLLGNLNLQWSTGIHWVICGGESGTNARPMHPDWARSLRDQCQSAGVPFFFKQWGEFAPMGTYMDPIVCWRLCCGFWRFNSFCRKFTRQFCHRPGQKSIGKIQRVCRAAVGFIQLQRVGRCALADNQRKHFRGTAR